MDVIVRAATPVDKSTIVELSLLVYANEAPFDKTLDVSFPLSGRGGNYLDDRISNDDGAAIVAVTETKTVGFILGVLSHADVNRNITKFGELESMFVLSDYRSQGVGSLLVDRFTNWSRARGAQRVRVIASTQNTRSIEFYKHFGFADCGVVLEKEI